MVYSQANVFSYDTWIKHPLRFQDLLEYRKKMRNLRIRLLDGTLKTVLVDDSQPVANMMVVICSKIGKFCIHRKKKQKQKQTKRIRSASKAIIWSTTKEQFYVKGIS